ncbi:MAG: hypothetical protein CVU84_03505 [Firmicutes bacterium HGW-Firmicutes-1]|jgi:hypothetical protein|nr:MAG: hypothetical protein CVU84_03505 [Firmicutes bacterium HGW-Firmicutes-1]
MWNRVLGDVAEESCNKHRRRPSDVEGILCDILDSVENIEECTCDQIVPLLRRILNAVENDDKHRKCRD